jgi:L-aspartate oxidase
MENDLVPISPAAHYLCGGIETDLNGFTCVSGLYAFGECAYTGLHGANRLASNSLLEALVVSSNLAEIISIKPIQLKSEPSLNSPTFTNVEIESFRKLMWKNAGIVRNKPDLLAALEKIKSELNAVKYSQKYSSVKDFEYLNMLQVGAEIIKAAISREHSLGSHLIQEEVD